MDKGGVVILVIGFKGPGWNTFPPVIFKGPENSIVPPSHIPPFMSVTRGGNITLLWIYLPRFMDVYLCIPVYCM